MPNVAVIVLNWNRARDTLECLASLLPVMRATHCTLICCDNGSSDDSVGQILAWAETQFGKTASRSAAKFILLANRVNAGYAAGNNAAIRYTLEQANYDYIWILNNDTIVKPNALSELLHYAQENNGLGAIGSTVVDYDHPTRVQCAGGYRYWPATTIMKPVWAGKSIAEVTAAEPTAAPRLDYISGAAMLLSVPAIKEIGLLDECFFLYYEEADYALRLRQRGWRLGWCQASIVLHKGGVSTGESMARSADRPTVSLATYHENLSTLLFTAKHYPYWFVLAAGFRLLAKILVSLARRRTVEIKALLLAYKDYYKSNNRQPSKETKSTVKFSGWFNEPTSH